MGHHYITEIRDEKFEFTTKSRIIVTVVFIVGLILAAIGAMNVKNNWDHAPKDAHASQVEAPATHEGGHAEAATTKDAHAKDEHAGGGAHHHEKSWITRVWANFVMNSYYFMLFSIGALFFIAVNYAANAGWSTLLKRVAEAVSGYLPVAFITIGAVVLFGKGEIYHWYQYLSQGLKEGQDGYDAILAGKTWFLNNNFFTFGVIIIIGLWILFRTLLRRASLKEDSEGGMIQYLKSIKLSAAFLVIFAFSFSILSWMIMMSIDAHWFSTIFSVYNFAIAFVTGLTVLMFFTLYLKSKGYLEIVSDEVIHDLGKFMFAFSFWLTK